MPERWPGTGHADSPRAERLACPSCGTGRLKRWGHGRERTIRLFGSATARLRPDRARCRSCGRTHIVPSAWCALRRADAIEVIGSALASALGGAGYGRIGADLGVPPGTVRGWLRRRRAADFIAVLGMLVQAFPQAPVIVVICDNDSNHHARKVTAYLKEHPRLELLYGARYSSHANPA